MCKKYNQLTTRIRYVLEDLIQEGQTQSYIAERVGCDKSTISRELARNRDKNGIYNAEKAKVFANDRCQRKRFKNFTESIIEIIRSKLVDRWAPEVIFVHLND